MQATKSGTGPRDYGEDVNYDMQPDYSNLHTYPKFGCANVPIPG